MSFVQILGLTLVAIYSLINFVVMIITFGNKTVGSAFVRIESTSLVHLFGARVRIIRDEAGVRQGIDKPLLVISNHQSLLDIVVLYMIMPGALSFIAKKELFRVPFLNFHLWATGALSIDRYSPRKAYRDMEYAARVLKRRSVFMFPEGTRQTEDAIGSFKKGFLKLALDSGCDIVPVVSRGSGKVLRKKSFRVGKNKPIDIIIGRPWTHEELSKPGAVEWIREWFVKGFEELKGLRPDT
jgi:1-acyl-sn-glycerol-3-phosphate acyltransferase